MRSPLEPAAEELRAQLSLTTDWLVDYVESLATRPAFDETDLRGVADLVRKPMPEDGTPLDALLPLIFERLVPSGVNPASPGSLSYVNGGGLWHAALAGLIVALTNRFTGFAAAAPALVKVESTVLRWFCDLIGLPSSAGGVLLTGGSTANFSAIVAARHERLGGADVRTGTIYTSDQAHHSVRKAALLAGVPLENVRLVPSDSRMRVSLDALEDRLRHDQAEGLHPFCIVGVAGSTNTGAVDDLVGLASIAHRHELWFHVDAAYGGFFQLTERGRQALAGIDLADSVTLDPHKSLFFPFGSGCLLVRDVATLRRAHELHSACVATVVKEAATTGRVNFADLSIEQTREARGLEIWLPLQMLGARAFREALDEKLDLARLAAERIAAIPGLELLAPPELSSFAFRVVRPDKNAEAEDAQSRRLVDLVNAGGRVHLAPTEVHGRVAVRVCVLVFRTHRPTIEAFLDRLGEAARQIMAAGGTT